MQKVRYTLLSVRGNFSNMQALIKKSKPKSIDKAKDEKTGAGKKKEEEKNKKITQSPTTPRNFVQKAKTTDIYSQNNAKAPKKTGTTLVSNSSPMKNLLRSSNSTVSSISQGSTKSLVDKRPVKAVDAKVSGRKSMSVSNVTVKTPPPIKKNAVSSGAKVAESRVARERRNTRTLPEEEVKVLTPEVIDNNAQMAKLTKTLKAQPKSFYVDLDNGKFKTPQASPAPAPPAPPPLSPDVSYSDDFESYASDFESCRSSSRSDAASADLSSDASSDKSDGMDGTDEERTHGPRSEEKMLDSGSYELRSARARAALAGIREEAPASWDEGFQDGGGGEGGDRPVFLDFKKSKLDRKRRQNNERLRRRARDLLGMIQLHEMSYNLFEMKPIAYDIYMATFGRSNYLQQATQTFDDGVERQIQTEEIVVDSKWTQHPVEFSKQEAYLTSEVKDSIDSDDTFKKFSLLLNTRRSDETAEKDLESHRSNALRLYFDQKDGVGSDTMMSVERYKNKLENTQYNVDRLSRFLKKVENKVCNVLSLVTGNTTDLKFIERSDIPFSKGYHKLNTSSSFLQHREVSKAIFSDSKSNLVLTVHSSKEMCLQRNVICLWDISVASEKPKKVLASIDDITVCRFRGDSNGIFVAALKDGSIHLWDLSEDTSKISVATGEETTELLENCKDDASFPKFIQSCAYTNSAQNLSSQTPMGDVVGLEISSDTQSTHHYSAHRNYGQVYALQNIGVLTIWTILQEKHSHSTTTPTSDRGKAFWSKMQLQIHQSIYLTDFLNAPDENETFNLNAGKMRMAAKMADVAMTSVKVTAARAVSAKKKSSVWPAAWDCGVVCTDLKVVYDDVTQSFLVAKNCGEVLRCLRVAGAVKVERRVVSADKATIVSLAVCGPQHYLAASETGAVHLCSLLEAGVLHTLDCSIRPAAEVSVTGDRCESDARGRFVASVPVTPVSPPPPELSASHADMFGTPLQHIVWCAPHAYVLTRGGAALRWHLGAPGAPGAPAAQGAPGAQGAGAVDLRAAGGHMVLVTSSREVQIHKLIDASDKTGTDQTLQDVEPTFNV